MVWSRSLVGSQKCGTEENRPQWGRSALRSWEYPAGASTGIPSPRTTSAMLPGKTSLLEGTEQTRKPRALFQVTSGPNQSDFMFENEILVPGWIQKEYSFPGLFLEYPWHVEIS